jgi:LPS sulfotransferase NodH
VSAASAEAIVTKRLFVNMFKVDFLSLRAAFHAVHSFDVTYYCRAVGRDLFVHLDAFNMKSLKIVHIIARQALIRMAL